MQPLLRFNLFRFQGQESAIITLIALYGLVFQFYDLIDRSIEEIPIMGYQQHGAGVVIYIMLKPFCRCHIEMTFRLIEQQQIGIT